MIERRPVRAGRFQQARTEPPTRQHAVLAELQPGEHLLKPERREDVAFAAGQQPASHEQQTTATSADQADQPVQPSRGTRCTMIRQRIAPMPPGM